jgi:ribonuclease Y
MPPLVIATYVVTALITVAVGFGIGFFILIRPLEARERARVDELVREKMLEAERLREVAQQSVETARKQALLETKEAEPHLRSEMENEHREKRAEIQRLERRLAQKEETLERRVETMEARERQLQDRDSALAAAKLEADSLLAQQRTKLQTLAGITREEARGLFL